MLLPPESVLVLTRGGTGRRDGMLKCSINVFEFAKTGNDARDELLTKFCLLISVEGESWKQGDDIGVDVVGVKGEWELPLPGLVSVML